MNVVTLRRAPPAKRTKMDTILLDQAVISSWKSPPFQRPLRINDKVRSISVRLQQDGGVLPGVLTLGIFEEKTYLLDGQHRVEAFKLSELKEGLADVRIVTHDSMADMGAEFVELNSPIVRMRPDDVLRGLEESTPILGLIRRRCPFVGYDNIRRGDRCPVVSMSALLRVWVGSAPETPQAMNTSAAHLAADMSVESATELIDFLQIAISAWGRGQDVVKLWGNLNLSLCMWLYRRLVLDTGRVKAKKYVSLKPGQFRACLMALAASSEYNEWLVGRTISDRDRQPCYGRIKTVFQRRLKESDQIAGAIRLPQPPWGLS